MAIDREKYRRLFLEEARESLRTFGNELVSLEKLHAAGIAGEKGAARAREVMDAAFRTAHSLKGMGAAMGYTRFAELAHRLEDLADVARGGGNIGTEGFDLLLEGADRLEEMVEKVAGGDEDPAAGDLTQRVQAAVERLRAAIFAPPPPVVPSTPAPSATAPPTTIPTPAPFIAAPGAAGPFIAAPGAAGPFVAAPGAAGPFVAAPGAAGPFVAAPGAAGPFIAAPGAAGPFIAAPGAAGPFVAVPAVPVRGAPRGLLVVKVKIADDASLPQVRAFVVHKALATLPGWKETEPTPESLRTKELPGRTLIVRFDPADADVEAIGRVARAQQAVADVTIGRDELAPAAEEAAAPAAVAAPNTGEDDRTVRVRTALLDDLLDSVGELLLARSRIRAIATRVDLPDLADLVDEVDRLTRDLHGRVVAARMTPLAFIAERFPRVVRDLARSSKKSVDFAMQGTEIELDRAILDELSAPFLHMLRNAVDHAHEGDDARRAASKPAAMKLVLRASRERDTVLLELLDDGGGMDAARIRKRAVDRDLITLQQANALTDAQSLELICLPGFSTAEQVSQTSGRGVGMDVVKATLERLGGTLRIESQPGQGTRMVLQLPLTVAIIQVLVVEAGVKGARDAYAIPVTRVEQALELSSAGVSLAHGRTFMKHGTTLVPLFDLGSSLGYGGNAGPTTGTVILVGRGKDVAAIRVDAILGQEEVVAKPLGPPLSSFGYLAGATLLADGRAAFILEPLRLVQAAI